MPGRQGLVPVQRLQHRAVGRQPLGHLDHLGVERLAASPAPGSKRSGRVWSPIRSRSPKPRVTKRATGAPLRSSRALVPRVVARRISTGGRERSWGVPVRSRAASTGASSGERTSNAFPGAGVDGSRRGAGGGSLGRSPGPRPPRRHPHLPGVGRRTRRAGRRRRDRRSGRSGGSQDSSTTSSSGATTSATRPRREADDSTFSRCGRPSGSKARQSVKVPPVSMRRRQRGRLRTSRLHPRRAP